MRLMLVTNPPGTGGSHKWEETTPSLEGILQEAGHTVDVTSTGEELARPDLASYDAILLNMWRNPRFGVDLEEAERDGLQSFVSHGGGSMMTRSIHVSPDSCPYWPAMQEMTAHGGPWVTGKSTHPPLMTFTQSESRTQTTRLCRGRGRFREGKETGMLGRPDSISS